MLMQQGIGYVLNFTRCNKPTDYTGKIPSTIRWAGASVQITRAWAAGQYPGGKETFSLRYQTRLVLEFLLI